MINLSNEKKVVRSCVVITKGGMYNRKKIFILNFLEDIF